MLNFKMQKYQRCYNTRISISNIISTIKYLPYEEKSKNKEKPNDI